MSYFEQQDKVLNCQTLIMLLVELGKQRGVHPDQLLKGTRLFYADLAKNRSEHNAISHQQFVRLIENVRKLLKQPDVPFLIGRRLFPTQLGNMGSALMNAKTLSAMLRVIKCYQGHIFPFMFLTENSSETQHFLFLHHAISHENTAYNVFMNELVASLMLSAIKWRTGNLPPISIRFGYQQPKHVEQYQVYLPCKTQYVNSAVNLSLQLSIDKHALLTPLPEANTALTQHYLKQLPQRNRHVGLIQYILQIMSRRFNNKQDISLEIIAEQLAVSPATLKRKLTAHRCSYQGLYDLFRQQHAVFKLTEQGLSNSLVAEELNFTDITNFRRSFKRWTGLTPNALKELFI